MLVLPLERQNLLISLLFLNLYTGSKQTNASNINSSSLTYKVLTTNQPQYLYNFISVQPCHDTRSSFMVTLASPPILSSLKVANRSFRYAAPCLWNKLPTDFASLIRYSLLHFHLSHMAVHHLHHLHCHHLHLLLLVVQSFILNLIYLFFGKSFSP